MSLLGRWFAASPVPLEQQLEELASCRIRLRPEFSIETLLDGYERAKYERPPYAGALIRMGGELEREPFTRLSDNIWHLNTQCIEAPGDYGRLAERMRALAQGDLPIENIRDRVDLENGDAWLELELRGETIHWGARVQGDWIDPEILSHVCSLLRAQKGQRRYTYLDLRGQDCLIGCSTEDEMRRLRKVTGLPFTWLE